MSASASQANLAPTWKEEVNQRLAAHRSRKSSTLAELEAPEEIRRSKNSVAADAAARVAARYAKAPSYSEMLAAEARAAVRAAESVSRAAMEAQAAAESVLAGLEAESAAEQMWESEASSHEEDSEWAHEQAWRAAVRTDGAAAVTADLSARTTEPEAARATRGPGSSSGPGIYEIPAEYGWKTGAWARDGQSIRVDGVVFEAGEAAQPLHANLIEFPRELVATRKVRPRLAEGPFASAGDSMQLSIFEVDPGSISTEPLAAEAVTEAPRDWTGSGGAGPGEVRPDWAGSTWADIELGAHPREEAEVEGARTAAIPPLHPASMSLRVMATVVDVSLVAGAFLAAAMLVMRKMTELPGLKGMEMASVVVLLVIGVAYMVFFFTMAEGTPGMKWAGISLCTFSDEMPTREQRWARLVAIVLSLLPVGLGMAWAIFDEEHLSWHDRLSQTYLRRG